MKRLTHMFHDRQGVTLLEVLIVVTVVTVVTASLFQLYILQHRTVMTQRDVSQIQQNARVSIDELARHIRMAGYGLPPGLTALEAANTNPDTITVTYQARACNTYLADRMPQSSSRLKCATAVSCFSEGQWVYIFDPHDGAGEWLEITGVEAASNSLQHNTTQLSRAYDADAVILSLERIKFYIDRTADSSRPTLMVQLIGQPPQVYAEDIEDIQFRYRMKNGVVVDAPLVANDVCEVMIGVTAGASRPDLELADRTADTPRQRSLATSVSLRNMES